MLGFFKRGDVVDFPIIFISRINGELIDPINPTVEVSHYEGTAEIIDLVETPLTKITTRPVGYYTYEFTVLESVIDDVYYVRWRGTDPASLTGERDLVEDTYKVVPTESSGGGNCCGLIPRFNKC